MNKCVFFDRDGTLIIDKDYLNDPDGVLYIEGVFEGLKKLQDAGYLIVVVTNQSGVASGRVDESNVIQIHKNMHRDFKAKGIEVTDWLYAPYLNTSHHYYRKPQPGMLLEAALFNDIDLTESWMVGDKVSDVEAGKNAGTKTILYRGSKDKKSKADLSTTEFSEVIDFILNSK